MPKQLQWSVTQAFATCWSPPLFQETWGLSSFSNNIECWSINEVFSTLRLWAHFSQVAISLEVSLHNVHRCCSSFVLYLLPQTWEHFSDPFLKGIITVCIFQQQQNGRNQLQNTHVAAGSLISDIPSRGCHTWHWCHGPARGSISEVDVLHILKQNPCAGTGLWCLMEQFWTLPEQHFTEVAF